jgi:hypothetical protein
MRHILLTTLALAACTPTTQQTPTFLLDATTGDTAPDTAADVAPPVPDVGLSTDSSLPAGTAALTAKVRMAKDFPNQVASGLRSYVSSGGALTKGDLWLELCADANCQSVQYATVALQAAVLTSSTKDVQVAGLPAGTFYARFVLDSQYSAKDYAGGVAVTGHFGPMDVLQSAGLDPRPTEGHNPPPGTSQVTLTAGTPVDAGEAILGTLVLPDPSFPPTPEHAWLVAATSGAGEFRNAMKLVDLDTYAVQPASVPLQAGKPFEGDLCGFVRGSGSALYVIGVGGKGASIFTWDLATQKFSTSPPAFIPHPDCKKGTCSSSPDAASFPFPCRGVSVAKDGKDLLYLSEWKGAGSLGFTQAYQLVVAKMDPAGGGTVVALHGPTEGDFLTVKRIFRGIALADGQLLLEEPSWSSQLADEAKKQGTPAQTTVYRVPFTATGDVDFTKRTAFPAGVAADTCGSVVHWPPAFGAYPYQGKTAVFVGSDDALQVFATDGTPLGNVETKDYGRLPTSLALSPNGKLLYAMPNCKADKARLHLLKGVGKDRAELDRQQIAVLALDATTAVPQLVQTARDFDEDGVADGGIDAEFAYLKRDLLRWCKDCTGVVPPTSYTGPEIAVGSQSLFLRGTGAQSTGKNSAGLGQVSDLGVFDLARGMGVIFRDYRLWTDGPSARWGLDLRPENATRTYDDDQSVGAILLVPKP